MSSFSKTSLLLAIGLIASPAAAFTPSLPSTRTPKLELHLYRPEDGYGGGGGYGEYPMDPMGGGRFEPQPPAAQQAQEYEAMVYDHALDCANNPGMCAIDELMGLAQDLEEFQECYVQFGPEACQQEAEDRHMLADALLAQRDMEIQNLEMSQMPFGAPRGGNEMMYGNNGFVPSNEALRMDDNNRYQNRAMPNSGKDKRVEHDRAGFIDL